MWIGSWGGGRPTLGRDVALSLVGTHSEKYFRDRLPDDLPCGFPVGLFPYTHEGFECLGETSPAWDRSLKDREEF